VRLEQEARSRDWLCPPRRHKHASGPLRRLAATCSARSLPPACVRMAFACSAAHGGVVTATRPVAFSGRLRGVLAGARGTWAGVVLGHKTAVLEVMPQVGQPRCGIVSKSTVMGAGVAAIGYQMPNPPVSSLAGPFVTQGFKGLASKPLSARNAPKRGETRRHAHPLPCAACSQIDRVDRGWGGAHDGGRRAAHGHKPARRGHGVASRQATHQTRA